MKRKLVVLAAMAAISTASHASLFGPSEAELRVQELEQQNAKITEELMLQRTEAAGVNGSRYEPAVTKTVTQVNIPAWYISTPKPTEQSVFVAGTATSNTLSMAVQKAILDADTKLAFQMESAVEAMIKTYQNDLGTELVENTELIAKKISAVTINGHYQVDSVVQQEGNTFRVFVLMRFPMGDASYFAERVRKQAQRDLSVVRQQSAEKQLDADVTDKQRAETEKRMQEIAVINGAAPEPATETQTEQVIVNPVTSEVTGTGSEFVPASSVDISKLPHRQISDAKLRAEIDSFFMNNPNAVVLTDTLQ